MSYIHKTQLFFYLYFIEIIILVGDVNYLLPSIFLLSLDIPPSTTPDGKKNCFKGSQRGVSVVKSLDCLFLYLKYWFLFLYITSGAYAKIVLVIYQVFKFPKFLHLSDYFKFY